MADRYIAIAGNIGVGKTSVVQYLESRYGFRPVYEPFADNPYLKDFYEDMPQWAFHSQMWFLSHKYRVHCDLAKQQGTLVQDRSIYEDAEIFATYLYKSRRMRKRDYDTYMELYRAMRDNLPKPDLLIYLSCSVRTIKKRIRQRGRPYEQDIGASYLRKLNELYADWIGRWQSSPVLVWDSEGRDYLEDLVHRLEFHKAIERFL